MARNAVRVRRDFHLFHYERLGGESIAVLAEYSARRARLWLDRGRNHYVDDSADSAG